MTVESTIDRGQKLTPPAGKVIGFINTKAEFDAFTAAVLAAGQTPSIQKVEAKPPRVEVKKPQVVANPQRSKLSLPKAESKPNRAKDQPKGSPKGGGKKDQPRN